MTRRVRWLAAVLIAGVVAVGLTGCGGGDGVDESMTLKKAKKIALAAEDETAALIPDKYVAKHQQLKKGTLLSCTHGGYSWTGQTTIYLKGGPDTPALIDKIKKHWDKKPGYKADVETNSVGEPRVWITASDGANYSAELWHSDTEVKIASFSPCFKLDPDMYPGGEF